MNAEIFSFDYFSLEMLFRLQIWKFGDSYLIVSKFSSRLSFNGVKVVACFLHRGSNENNRSLW